MNVVISDPKTGKTHGKKTEEPVFLHKKIGEEVPLDVLGLAGFKAKIAGGSDKQGFPMKKTFPGIARKKIMISKGTGFRPKRKGIRRRISVRGNVVSDEITQLNLVITQHGDASLEMLLGKKGEAKEEKKGEVAAETKETTEQKKAEKKEEKAVKKIEEKEGKEKTKETKEKGKLKGKEKEIAEGKKETEQKKEKGEKTSEEKV